MNAIEVKNVYKSFKIYHDKGSTLKEKVLFKNRDKHEVHQVLKGVDLKIKKGEVVGLVGENGCGKSTLLKLMTRIIYPDQGSIEVNGKVSSLLELGAGFHPDMTGRENIYTNASIFGLGKKEIDKRIENIIEFSELGEFIDNPVRTYSSGMYMRLAFSVAINVDADILLVDEILAVGDASFQAKCFNKMQEIKKQGTTIVIVSHNLGSIESLCDKAIWINEGKVISENRPNIISYQYLDWIMNKDQQQKSDTLDTKQEIIGDKREEEDIEASLEGSEIKRWGNKEIVISDIQLVVDQKKTNKIRTGQNVDIYMSFKKNKDINDFTVGISINRMDGVLVYGTNTKIDKCYIKDHQGSEGQVCIKLKDFNILQGEYSIDVAIESVDSKPYDYYCDALRINTYSPIEDVGIIRINHDWLIDGNKIETSE